MSLVDYLAWLVAGLMLVPFAMLTLELLAALLPLRSPKTGVARPRVAVLVPAHNEEVGISRTISNIQPQLQSVDQLIVIADNCTDRTAEIARQLGATTIERKNDTERGKGFALDFGLKHLAADPPEVVIVIDADTAVDRQAIGILARTVAEWNRPVQASNLLDAPPNSGPGTRIGAFAFFLKNYVRPRGLNRMGFPCLLYGTGMALPYDLIAKADLAHGDITEDIRLGLELAMMGKPPMFCPEARVFGELPTVGSTAHSQRRRWEHGHLRTLFQHVPRLLGHGITKARPALLTLALHIGIPPLSFLFLVGMIVAAALLLFGQTSPAMLLGSGMFITTVIGMLCWLRFGRGILPWRDLVMLPVYVVSKIPLYFRFFTRPQKAWVRTERTNSPVDDRK